MSAVENLADEISSAPHVDQFQVFAWLESALAALETSRWAPQLTIDGISVLDALRAECMVEFLRFGREGGAETVARQATFTRRLMDRIRRAAYVAKKRYGEHRARGHANLLRPARFVAFPTEPTHFQMLQPIVDELRRRGESCAYYTMRAKLWHRMRASGVEAIWTGDCWPRQVVEARKRGRQIARQLARDAGVQLPPFPELGPGELLLAHFREVFSMHMPTIAETIATAKALFADVRPEVVLIGNDNTLEGRVLVHKAKEHGIATVAPMHGNVTGNPVHGRHITDRFLLFGEASRRIVTSYGQDPAPLVVTGPVHLDDRPRQSGQTVESVRRQLGLDGSRPLVLGLLSGARQNFSLPHHLLQVEALMRASAEFPELHVVAKLHRVDLPRFYDEVRERVPDAQLRVVPYAAPGYPTRIYDWLQGCRLVLTGASATAVESMLMDVPVITMDLRGELREIDFIDRGATIHVRSIDELMVAIRDVLSDAPRAQEARRRAHEYLVDCYGPLDGRASARAADEVMALCRPCDRATVAPA